jgi:hypothetical protein
LNLGVSKKVIFFYFLLINILQPGKTDELYKNYKNDTNLIAQKDFSKTLNIGNLSNSLPNNNLRIIPLENIFFGENSDLLLAYRNQKHEELVVESDKQSEIDEVIYAEGNVSVFYKGKLLKADNLIFDKLNKKISAEGNITLISGDQVFQVSQLEYSFFSKKGYLKDVKGYINSNTLMNDLFSSFHLSDANKIETLLELKKKEVINTPSKVENWFFWTDKITIDGKKWKSKKAIFSNDLLELKQVKFAVNALEVIGETNKLQFKSSLSYLIFDEKLSIPFWLGNRALNKAEEDLDAKSSWTIGYENLDKDGLFIGRKLKSIYLGDDFIIDLEPQFLIQRSFNGHTKSFVEKGDLITESKVERDTEFADNFGFKSQIQGKVNNWDLKLDNQINSFDFNKFSDALRFKSLMSREINLLNSKWDKSVYGVYRDRVWNGSLGDAEIYIGYGSKLEKKRTWEVNGIAKTEVLSLGLAYLKGEALISKNLVDSFKGNLFYSLNQKIPLRVNKPKNKVIDKTYKYIHEPIQKGLSLNTRIAGLYSLYDDGKHQEYVGLGIGTELILGNFKSQTFDYTRVSIFPFYKFKNGDSIFRFDQISDKFTLDIGFDQQLFGPILLQSIGTLNLDNDSNDYGEFISSKVSLNWKKRSYEFGIFYQPHNESGGISFSLFGFK